MLMPLEATTRLLVLLVALPALLACRPERAPATQVESKLQVSSPPREGEHRAGVARVVFFSPQGEATANAEIAVVFDRPLRALGDTKAPIRATLEPPVDGS